MFDSSTHFSGYRVNQDLRITSGRPAISGAIDFTRLSDSKTPHHGAGSNC